VLLVVAAGNDGDVMSVLGQSSQEFENIITVGSSDGFGRSDYSSYGYGLDILVPGGTIENPTLSTVGDDIGTMSGTSASAAKAAGMASKVWEANPDLSVTQVIDILTGSAIDLKDPGWDQETGFGVVNLNKAVQVAKDTKPQSYTPSPFLSPTTWGLEGKVTPWERATYDIKTGSFTSIMWSTTGVTLRNSPSLSDKSTVAVGYKGQVFTFDAWTYGEIVLDLTTQKQDALWFRTNVNGKSYWVPSAYTKGYPPGDPPLLPPTNSNPVVNPPNSNPVVNPPTSNPVVNPPTSNPVVNPPTSNPVVTPPSSISLNGRTIGGNFYPVFQNYKGTLGNPTSDAINYNGVSYQTFEKGSIVSSKNGTFPLYGAIRQEFLKTGGLDGWLGAPKSAEKGQGDGTLIQYFEKGYISWNGVKAIAYQEGSKPPIVQIPSNIPSKSSNNGGSGNSSYLNELASWSDEQWNRAAGENTRITGPMFPGEKDERNYSGHGAVLKLYDELSNKLLNSPLGSPYRASAGYVDVSYGDMPNVGWHDGIDIVTSGKILDVKVIVGGTVRQLIYSGKTDVGYAIEVKGDDGRFYHYLHLSSLKVSSGRIEANQTLGQVGDTKKFGISNHLHFQVNKSAKTDECGNTSGVYNIHNKTDVYNSTYNPLKVFWELKREGRV
jgi:Subtilase family/Peptidase family M23/LGFP repeat